MAKITDISFKEGKGSDFYIECIVTDAEDVSAFEAYFRMAEDDDPNSPTKIAKNSVDVGQEVELFNNRVVVGFTSSETDYSSSVLAGEYYIEITLEDEGGNKKLVGKGIATFVDTNIKLGS